MRIHTKRSIFYLLLCGNLILLLTYSKGFWSANLTHEEVYPEDYSNLDDPEIDLTCKFKTPQPFHPSITSYIYKPAALNCSKVNYPPLFSTDFENNLFRLRTLSLNGFSACCYRVFSVEEKVMSEQCSPITRKRTKIPPSQEYIGVYCWPLPKYGNETLQLIDMFWFVNPKKPDLVNKILENPDLYNRRGSDKESLNVFILGLDGVSEANFHRQMPLSAEYLKGALKATFMKGYNKLGDNTFPNVVPLLTGQSVEELRESCWLDDEETFDLCPFIWKNFSARGWVTSYSEDSASISTFEYLKHGFDEPPTDYYLIPWMHLLDRELGHNTKRCDQVEGDNTTVLGPVDPTLVPSENCYRNCHFCYGHRLGFEYVLENLERTAQSMKKASLKTFHFTWSNSLFHDHLNDPSLGDDLLRGALERLKNGGYLEDSLLIICSDHGIRYGPIRQTVQGKMEERMPLLSFVLPEWFSSKYPRALANLRRNSQRLTTHFDLHETLGDFLDMGQALRNREIDQRTVDLQRKGTPPRGQSLFLPVSPQRSCPDAGIDPHWCICNSMESLEPLEKYPEVGRGAQAVVSHINDILFRSWNVHSPEVECAQLQLVNITSAQRLRRELEEIDDKDTTDGPEIEVTYEVGVVTAPGGGSFEVTLTHLNSSDEWKVSNSISRTNLYGNQSWCVDKPELKKLCFCQLK